MLLKNQYNLDSCIYFEHFKMSQNNLKKNIIWYLNSNNVNDNNTGKVSEATLITLIIDNN